MKYNTIQRKTTRYLRQHERKAATVGIGIDSPLCLYAVVTVCVATDYFTIYTSLESVLTENQFISVLLALVSAILLDGLAVPFVRALKRYRKTHQAIFKIELVVSAVAFLLIYLLTVVVKVSGAKDLFHVADLSIAGFAAQTQAEEPLTASQIAMVAYLAILPLITSLFSAVVCFRTVSTRVYRLKAQLHEVKLAAAACEGRIEQYKMALAAPLEARDQETFRKQIDFLRTVRTVGKIDAYSEYILSGSASTPEDLDLARSYAERLAAGTASAFVPTPAGAETVQLDFSATADRQAT